MLVHWKRENYHRQTIKNVLSAKDLAYIAKDMFNVQQTSIDKLNTAIEARLDDTHSGYTMHKNMMNGLRKLNLNGTVNAETFIS